MKLAKAVAVLLITLVLLGALAACAPAGNQDAVTTPADDAVVTTPADDVTTPAEDVKDDTVIRIGGMTGPTSIGLVKVMEDNDAGTAKNKYDFTIVGAADEITPKLIKGELDIAALPANVASVLYNNTDGKVKLLAINTLGVLYIVQKGETVASVADLRGKTIYATGKGQTPEFTLRYILSRNGIDPDNDVTIEFKSEPAEIVGILKNGNGIAMLPQPFVTVAQGSVEGLRVALSMVDEWNALETGSQFVTGVLAVRRDFAEKYPQQLSAFLDEYKASIEYANTNVAETALLVEQYGIVKAAVAEKALPKCNIAFYEGAEMKSVIEGYYEVLFAQNPASVGGALPGDDFYYSR